MISMISFPQMILLNSQDEINRLQVIHFHFRWYLLSPDDTLPQMIPFSQMIPRNSRRSPTPRWYWWWSSGIIWSIICVYHLGGGEDIIWVIICRYHLWESSGNVICWLKSGVSTGSIIWELSSGGIICGYHLDYYLGESSRGYHLGASSEVSSGVSSRDIIWGITWSIIGGIT
jgi:hypothetical protein